MSNNKSKDKKNRNLNEGHRERLRQRYLDEGLDSFRPHEILELLMFYSRPRINTNDIAHRLINEFGSLANVLDADMNEIVRVEGVGKSTALFLQLLPDVFRAYMLSKQEKTNILNTRTELKNYVKNLFIGETVEKFIVICFDNNLDYIDQKTISTGSSGAVNFHISSVIEYISLKRANIVVLAHNHPNSLSQPSNEDLFYTNQILNTLNCMDVILEDHFIIGKDGLYSMKDSGNLEF